MPLPANVTTVTVLGTFLTPEGDPSTGTISFTASSWLTNSGANVAIPNSTVTKTLGTAGNFSVSLPITDDPDISPSGFVYNVSEVVDGVSQNYNISIPGTIAGGGTLYLADLAPVAPAGPEYYSLASSLTIGTVTTVATGGSATASITGLAPSQVLNLGIPTGATGTVASAGSGSVSAAAVAPTGDPDTGIYFPAANQVAVTTGGTQALLLAAGAVSNPTFTGVASFPDGSASAPSITNTGDLNTGFFHPADDTVAISTGGTERVRVNSTGLGIGVAPTSALHIYGATGDTILQLTGDSSPYQIIRRASSDTGAGSIFIDKARGSIASPTIVSSGDQAGQIHFRAHDGVNYRTAARIQAEVDTTPGSGDMPGRLLFFTTPDGSTTTTERMRIDNAGLITGTGTSLGAWTSYTPTLGGTGWAIGNGTAVGYYCQIGKVVHFRAQITFGSTSTFGASNFPTISLPVTESGVSQGHVAHAVVRDTSLGAWYTAAVFAASTTTWGLFTIGTDGLRAAYSATVPFTWANTDLIQIRGTYEAS